MLMHYFAADDAALPLAEQGRIAALEAQAVTASHRIIATSEWTAQAISRRYDRNDVVVAIPGVDAAALAAGSLHRAEPTLLWLARVTATKDPLTFIDALAQLRDLPWRAKLVGPDRIEPDCAARARGRIAELELADRVTLTGAREGAALDETWHRTDLLVHTARAEAYGMVVTEAISRGIPSIVGSGTGAVEAQQGAGGAFVPGDAGDLAAVLRRWLTDGQVRAEWADRALKRRLALPTWEDVARRVAEVLE